MQIDERARSGFRLESIRRCKAIKARNVGVAAMKTCQCLRLMSGRGLSNWTTIKSTLDTAKLYLEFIHKLLWENWDG